MTQRRRSTSASTPPVFQRLSGKLPTATAWVEFVQDFGKLVAIVAGHPQTILVTGSRISGFPHRMRPRIRELLPTPGRNASRKTDGGKLTLPSLV
jgi:hypothetical protein